MPTSAWRGAAEKNWSLVLLGGLVCVWRSGPLLDLDRQITRPLSAESYTGFNLLESHRPSRDRLRASGWRAAEEKCHLSWRPDLALGVGLPSESAMLFLPTPCLVCNRLT